MSGAVGSISHQQMLSGLWPQMVRTGMPQVFPVATWGGEHLDLLSSHVSTVLMRSGGIEGSVRDLNG